jgi:hypothetical protein
MKENTLTILEMEEASSPMLTVMYTRASGRTTLKMEKGPSNITAVATHTKAGGKLVKSMARELLDAQTVVNTKGILLMTKDMDSASLDTLTVILTTVIG